MVEMNVIALNEQEFGKIFADKGYKVKNIYYDMGCVSLIIADKKNRQIDYNEIYKVLSLYFEEEVVSLFYADGDQYFDFHERICIAFKSNEL